MNYAKINLFDIANGKGIRVSLFVSGCQFHCKDCFNQCAQDYNFGKKFTDKEEKIILNRLNDDNFKGLSLIGGDPLWQDIEGLKQLISLCEKVHKMGKDVWIWSGFTWEEVFENTNHNEESECRKMLIKSSDVFIDGRFITEQKKLGKAWAGSTNQRVIDVKESLKQNNIVLYT